MASKGSKSKGETTTAMTRELTEEERAIERVKRENAQKLAKMGFAAVMAGIKEGKLGSEVVEAELVEKEELEGVPFIITMFGVYDGDYGADSKFAAVTCLLEDGSTVVFNDGSTGIFRTLAGDESKGIPPTPQEALPIACAGGVRASHYKYIDKITGEEKPATTWYLSGRPPRKRGNVNGRGEQVPMHNV